MNDIRQQIHDMIQTFPLSGSPELMASRILDILQTMNERMDHIEETARHARFAFGVFLVWLGLAIYTITLLFL